MLIVINVKEYYDFIPTDTIPTEADLLALRYKPAQDGKWLKKTIISKNSYTEIGIPEDQIQTLIAHYERIGTPKTRERVVAFLIEERVMPHNAHPKDWTSIEIHGDADLQNSLNKFFNLSPTPIQAAEAV